YLGLLLFAALQEPSLESVGLLALCTLGGLAVALAIAGYGKRRRGYQVKGRWPAFLLFLLLESPELVFAGVLLGTGLGALAIRNPETEQGLLLGTVGGGAVLGLGYWFVRHVRHRGWRLGLSLALAVAPVAVVLAW